MGELLSCRWLYSSGSLKCRASKWNLFFSHFALILLFVGLEACQPIQNSSSELSLHPEDSSIGGAIAGSIGGAISFVTAPGILVGAQPPVRWPVRWLDSLFSFKPAFASNACPTVSELTTPGCTNTAPNLLTFSLNACSYVTGSSLWNGFIAITAIPLQPSVTVQTCTNFPSLTMTSALFRQAVAGVASNSAAASVQIRNRFGTTITVDHGSADLANYQFLTIVKPYGELVSFNKNGTLYSIQIQQRIFSSAFDYSIVGIVPVVQYEGSTNQMVDGIFEVFHNMARVNGISTLTNLIYVNGCCYPVSGSISTVFRVTSTSNNASAVYNNQKEVVHFLSNCGQASVTDISGKTSTVQLTQCL